MNIPLGQMVRPLRPDNTGRVIATFFIGGARGMEQRGPEGGRERFLLSTLRAYIFYGSSTSKGEKASHQGQASAHAVGPPRVFKVRAARQRKARSVKRNRDWKFKKNLECPWNFLRARLPESKNVNNAVSSKDGGQIKCKFIVILPP